MCRAGQKNMSRIPSQESATPGGITQCILSWFPGEQSLEEYFADFIARHYDQKASIFQILKSIDEFKG